MKRIIVILLCLGASLTQVGWSAPALTKAPAATPAQTEEAIHDELRALFRGLLESMNKGDVEETVKFLHPNVVVTYQNAEVGRGHAGVRAYYLNKTTGPNKIVESYHAEVQVDELSILYGGDTAISFGSSEEDFKLTNGVDFKLAGRWSATLVKENGRWVIASLHASTNLFNNPLLTAAKKTAYWAGGICLVIGMAVGCILCRTRKKSSPTQ